MKAPLILPATGAAQQQFELQRVDYSAGEAGGRVGGVQSGFPLWGGVWNIGTIGQDRSDLWRSFMLQLRGATRRFLGRDLARPFPKAHITGFAGMTRAGGGSFNGSATDWSEVIETDGDAMLTLQGLPAALQLSVGDYVGFKWNAVSAGVAGLPWTACVRVVTAATADETGQVTVMVEPPVPAAIPASATAHLDGPTCVMVLLTDQSKLDAVDRRLAIRGGTIAGVQDLRR